jgi:hypothetical protein
MYTEYNHIELFLLILSTWFNMLSDNKIWIYSLQNKKDTSGIQSITKFNLSLVCVEIFQ